MAVFPPTRTRGVPEVDFGVDAGGRLELFETKWTEPPDLGDTVNTRGSRLPRPEQLSCVACDRT